MLCCARCRGVQWVSGLCNHHGRQVAADTQGYLEDRAGRHFEASLR